MAGMDKINFNISPELKRDIERLAHSYGKTLSAFLLDVCKTLVDSNKDRIKEQTEREKQPINFGGNVQTTKPKKTRTKTKKAAQSDSPVNDSPMNGVDDNVS